MSAFGNFGFRIINLMPGNWFDIKESQGKWNDMCEIKD